MITIMNTLPKTQQIVELLDRLEKELKEFPPPMSLTLVEEYGRDPFLVLIACLLSLRAKDRATIVVARALFSRARTPQEIIAIPILELEKIIYPIGFFKRKAQILHDVSHEIIERFGGAVPDSDETLSSIKHVGHKTAALVLAEGFEKPAICVDVHVHRIVNRLGFVHTSTPEATQRELEKIVPRNRWRDVNRLFVAWGQNANKLRDFLG